MLKKTLIIILVTVLTGLSTVAHAHGKGRTDYQYGIGIRVGKPYESGVLIDIAFGKLKTLNNYPKFKVCHHELNGCLNRLSRVIPRLAQELADDGKITGAQLKKIIARKVTIADTLTNDFRRFHFRKTVVCHVLTP